MKTSSVDIDKLLSKNFFLWKQCPKNSLLLFKNGADLSNKVIKCVDFAYRKYSPSFGLYLICTQKNFDLKLAR